MKKFDLKKFIAENKATFYSSLNEGEAAYEYEKGKKAGEKIEKKKLKESDLRSKIKEMILAEMNSDFTISDDEDEKREKLISEVKLEIDELIYKIKQEAEEIGGPFRSPGIIADCVKEIKSSLMDNGINLMEESVNEMDLDINDTTDEYDFLAEIENMLSEEDEEEVEVEDEEEIPMDEPKTNEPGKIDVTQNADADLTGNKKEVQDNLEAALEAAKSLGDEKLATQIGNSLTFFTKQHVVK
jgi:hypothetical protein